MGFVSLSNRIVSISGIIFFCLAPLKTVLAMNSNPTYTVIWYGDDEGMTADNLNAVVRSASLQSEHVYVFKPYPLFKKENNQELLWNRASSFPKSFTNLSNVSILNADPNDLRGAVSDLSQTLNASRSRGKVVFFGIGHGMPTGLATVESSYKFFNPKTKRIDLVPVPSSEVSDIFSNLPKNIEFKSVFSSCFGIDNQTSLFEGLKNQSPNQVCGLTTSYRHTPSAADDSAGVKDTAGILAEMSANQKISLAEGSWRSMYGTAFNIDVPATPVLLTSESLMMDYLLSHTHHLASLEKVMEHNSSNYMSVASTLGERPSNRDWFTPNPITPLENSAAQILKEIKERPDSFQLSKSDADFIKHDHELRYSAIRAIIEVPTGSIETALNSIINSKFDFDEFKPKDYGLCTVALYSDEYEKLSKQYQALSAALNQVPNDQNIQARALGVESRVSNLTRKFLSVKKILQREKLQEAFLRMADPATKSRFFALRECESRSLY